MDIYGTQYQIININITKEESLSELGRLERLKAWLQRSTQPFGSLCGVYYFHQEATPELGKNPLGP